MPDVKTAQLPPQRIGLTGGESVKSTQVEWQEFDLRTPGDRQRKEGQDAPEGEGRKRNNVTNVLQIHQEAVGGDVVTALAAQIEEKVKLVLGITKTVVAEAESED